MKFRIGMALISALALVGFSAAPSQADGHVIADDLVSPLGFAFGSDGTLYVGEAFIGQLTTISKSGKRSVLARVGDGSFLSGVDARGRGTATYVSSLPPEFQDGPPSDTTLNRVLPNGRSTKLASLLDYETANNPDASNIYGLLDASTSCRQAAGMLEDFIGPAVYPGDVESNPYAVVIDSDGSRVVADAAGNTLVRVRANGRMSTVAVLPPVVQELSEDALHGILAETNVVLEELGMEPLPLDALDDCIGAPYRSNPVPTDVEVGPDGDYFVSSLPGFPESPGAGSVFRVDRQSGDVSTVATGFTGAVDLAVASDGTIYVAELFAFQVSRVDPGDSTASASTFVECPGAVEIGRGGQLFAAEAGICSDGPPQPGRIVRLDL